MLIYRQGLEIQAAAAEPDTRGRYALDRVFIAPDGSIIACDGKQWLRMQASVDDPDLFTQQALDELPGDESLDRPLMVPADVVKAFLAASKRKTKKGQRAQHVVVAERFGQVTLATADGKTRRTFLIEPDESTFPDFERTIPRGKPAMKVDLDVDAMLKILNTLKRCGVNTFEMRLHKVNTPIRITAATYIDDCQAIVDGVMMPNRSLVEERPPSNEPPPNVDPTTGEIRETPGKAA